MKRKHLLEKFNSSESESCALNDEMHSSSANSESYSMSAEEETYCRKNESRLLTISNDRVKNTQNEHDNKRHYENESISRHSVEFLDGFRQLGITIFENISTIICMVYHMKLQDIEGKPFQLKSTNSLLQFSRLTEDFEKSVGKRSFIQDLFNPNIHFQQNIKVFPVSLNNYFESLTSGSSMPLDESMSNNLLRIYSFSSFPRQVNVFTSLLAKAGFYYTGVSDEVRCYACGLSYKDWSSADKPFEIHNRLSPSCSHVIRLKLEHGSTESEVHQNSASSLSNNLNTSISPALLSVPNTDSTLHLNNLSNPNSAITSENFTSLSENGSHTSTSFNCHVLDATNRLAHSYFREGKHCGTATETGVPSVNRADNSLIENARTNSQNGTHDQNAIGVSNATPEECISNDHSAGQNSIVDVNGDEAKYPNYGPIQIRISSFQGWPSYLDQTPHVMAKAGFLYAGYHDYTRCFFCGGGLRNWEAGDDPWIEHARWFPNCRYLKENKGERFIKAVQDKHAQLNRAESLTNGPSTSFHTSAEYANGEPSCAKLSNSHEHSHLGSVAVKSVLQMGYTESQIQQAIQKIIQSRNGATEILAVNILSQILGEDEANAHGRLSNNSITTEEASNVNMLPSLSNAHVNETCSVVNGTSETTKTSRSAVNGTSKATNTNSMVVNGTCDATNTTRSAVYGTSYTIGLDDSNIDDAELLVEENRQLKDQRLCKICLELDASIAFLPCGHLVCCSDCAPAMRKCPICRAFVKGTVKTFLV